jgi:hypothetical protein
LHPESIQDGCTNIKELEILTSKKYFQSTVVPGGTPESILDNSTPAQHIAR